MRLVKLAFSIAVLATCSMACSAGSDSVDEPSGEQPSEASPMALEALADAPEITEVRGPLAAGASGDDVLAVSAFLMHLGFFENAELRERYPQWQPVVPDLPDRFDRFTPELTEAVMQFQSRHGLEQNGLVDAATLEMMQQPRSADPFTAAVAAGADEKWSLLGGRWNDRSLTYRIASYPSTREASNADVNRAIDAAFDVWEGVTNLTFARVTTTADFEIRFWTRGSPPAGWNDFPQPNNYGYGEPPTSGRVAFNDAYIWSTAASTPANSMHMVSAAVHEIGHAIGLGHTSVSMGAAYVLPVMWPSLGPGLQRTAPNNDDRVAAHALYSLWPMQPGRARDIGVGANGSTWVIGNVARAGGYSIHYFTGGGWGTVSGGAVRIDVGPTGQPWVVNDGGGIFRRVGSGWERLPGAAYDVGVGGNGDVWVIGRVARGGGYSIHRWTGSSWSTVSGGAVRIDVDRNGVPWVVNDGGAIFRRSGNSWQRMPGCATDIGIGNDGSVWVTGCGSVPGGYGIFVWNEQGSGLNTPATYGWVQVDGGATNISVQADGQPWVVNSNLNIFRRQE